MNSSWNIAPDQYNFTTAKIGTPLSASCINVTGSEDAIAPLKPEVLVSRSTVSDDDVKW